MPTEWIFLGAGSYNRAYKSKDGREVLKIQKSAVDATDTPERSVRLWNAINAHVPPPARLEVSELGSGWVCPFIEGEQASDTEMAEALIDIYNRTGRIVVDATAVKNFVRTPTGQVLCVDVGMAMQLERREERGLQMVRRKSVVSLNAWSRLSDAFNPFFAQCAYSNPETVNVVKALLFIKYNRPDMYDVSFLKTKPELVNKLAGAYDRQNTQLALAHLDIASREETFPIPQDRIDRETANFVIYLRSKGSPFVLPDGKVQDMSLSEVYPNPKDNNKPYIDIKITNPEVAILFKDYIAEQARLAQERLAQERLVQERLAQERLAHERLAQEALDKQTKPILDDYNEKLRKITAISTQANADPKLSNSEKTFINRICIQLSTEINEGIKQITNIKQPSACPTEKATIDHKIDAQLQKISDEAVKIPRTSGVRGFINSIFEALGWEKPFHILNSKEVKDKVGELKALNKEIRELGAESPNLNSGGDYKNDLDDPEEEAAALRY